MMTVKELKDILDDFGDHLQVMIVSDTGDEVRHFTDPDIGAGSHLGESVVVIDVGIGSIYDGS